MLLLEVMSACIPALIGNLPETWNAHRPWNSVICRFYYMKEQAEFSEEPKIPASSMGSCTFWWRVLIVCTQLLVGLVTGHVYVAVTCRCGGGRGMIDHSVLSVTAFWVSNVKYSHAVLEGAQWRIAVHLLHAVTYRNSLTAHSDVSRFFYCTQWHRNSLTAHSDVSRFLYYT